MVPVDPARVDAHLDRAGKAVDPSVVFDSAWKVFNVLYLGAQAARRIEMET
jgi:hypothetical protein